MSMKPFDGKRKSSYIMEKKYSGKNVKAQLGFSLIELIVVIAIMAILVGLLVPAFVGQVAKNKRNACIRSREGVGKVIERCVYDETNAYSLNDTDVNSIATGATGGLTDSEKGEYVCPNKGSYTAWVEEGKGVVCIECSECGDVISVDLLDFKTSTLPDSDDNTVETPPTETETEEEEEFTVTFDANGRGTAPSPQKVKKNHTVDTTKAVMTDVKGYTFTGWYKESECLNPFDMSTPITEDIKLYAKWKGVRAGEVWPYSDDSEWWDPDNFKHGGEVTNKNISNNPDDTNTMWMVLKSPSGIFTSKNGGQFVYVHENDDQKIYYYEAMTPEYYSALHPNWLIQLTGNNHTIDITGYKGNTEPKKKIKNITNGDLVTFVDGDNEYVYVWWEDSTEAVTLDSGKVSAIRKYDNHPTNMYKVNP